METMNTTQTERKPGEFLHPFERAGLARAPYRFVRAYTSKFQACQGAPVQPGSSCDYCATGIMLVYVLRGSDGREFKVGCDCVQKMCRKGERVLTDVEKAARKHATEMRHAREAAKDADGEAFVARPDVVAFMETAPHPYQYRAEQGETLAMYLAAMLRMSGVSGRLRAYKTVRAAFANV